MNRRRYYARSLGATDTAGTACESKCLFAARDFVGDLSTWQKKLSAGMLPSGCDTQAGCIMTVKKQCMEENCCKLHNQLVDEQCGLAQMFAADSADLCKGALENLKSAGCTRTGSQLATVTDALTKFEASKSTSTTTTGTSTARGKSASTDSALAVPCSSREVIGDVQRLIGAYPDEQWGPKSQAALDAKGGNFRAFAPDCTGPVPSSSSGSKISSESTTKYVAQPAATPAQQPAPIRSAATQFPWDKLAIGAVAVGVLAAAVYAFRK